MQPLSKEYMSRLIRCIVEFNLIEDGDKILIGLSGGKDSLFMTYALSQLKQQLNKDFQLGAITVNPQFDKTYDAAELQAFCDKLALPLFIREVDIAEIVEARDNKNPCFSCSFFRRGAINGYAKENGYNKIAYAHNHDDAVHTFIMNLFYSGQLKTFMPSTYLSRTDLTVIRPILYFREKEIIGALKLHGQKPCAPSCPFNGHTMRQEAQDMVKALCKKNPLIYDHLSSAIRENSVSDLWPKPMSRKEIKPLYEEFFSSIRKEK